MREKEKKKEETGEGGAYGMSLLTSKENAYTYIASISVLSRTPYSAPCKVSACVEECTSKRGGNESKFRHLRGVSSPHWGHLLPPSFVPTRREPSSDGEGCGTMKGVAGWVGCL